MDTRTFYTEIKTMLESMALRIETAVNHPDTSSTKGALLAVSTAMREAAARVDPMGVPAEPTQAHSEDQTPHQAPEPVPAAPAHVKATHPLAIKAEHEAAEKAKHEAQVKADKAAAAKAHEKK